MSWYLGIDLGTSGLKAVLVRPDGCVCAVARRAYGIDVPRPGYAQQDPALWWDALCGAVRELVGLFPSAPNEIRGIGLSGQMHGTVLLDGDRQVLYPAILWCDQRSAEECRQLQSAVGPEQLGQWTLNPLFPGFQLASVLWVRAHLPAIYERTRHVLLPKDYLRLRMTGEIGTEVTDASSTLLFDCSRGDWSRDVLRAANLPPQLFPPARNMPYEIAGQLTPDAAADMGLRAGIPIAYGGGDQPMQAIGNGILSPGDASITLGTGGQILIPTEAPFYDPRLRTHTFCHAQPNRWYVMGATLNACLSLNWFMERVLATEDVKALDRDAGRVRPGAEDLVFLPYLTGERTPHMDPAAKGMFFGLTLSHGRDEMSRAVLEGVAYSLREAMEGMLDLHLPVHRLTLSGGGARSALWRQILTDVLEMPTYLSRVREAAGLGAAMCAMVGAGEYPSLAAACEQIVPRESEPMLPHSENGAIYRAQYQRFQSLYQRNKGLF